MLTKSLLWEAIVALTKAEERNFLRYLESAHFNTRGDLLALAQYLLQVKTNGKATTNSEIWAAAQKSGAPNETKLRLLFSDLFGLLESALLLLEDGTDAVRIGTVQTKVHLKKGLERHFQKSLRETTTLNEKQPHRHDGYYQTRLQLAWLQYQSDAQASRSGDYNLQTIADLTDQHFVLQKLRVACLQASHQKAFPREYHYGTLPFLLAYAAERNLIEIPAIGLYYYCYRFITEQNPDLDFQIFISLLREHASLFPDEELRTLYLLAINYVIKQLNAGRNDLVALTLDLYQDALDRQLLLENGLLSRFAFTNIVAIALRSGDTVRAKTFVHQYNSYLDKKHRTSIMHLNLARIAYAEKDYDAVLELAQKADYKDVMHGVAVRALQLKVYFETSEYTLLESHLASFRIYIKRQKQVGYRQETIKKLIQYTQMLVHSKLQNNPTSQQLEERIENENAVMEKEWLLAMLKMEG
jgi:hypothetical protein